MKVPDDEQPNATPLTPAEREGLIPSHITLRLELNELEQSNIMAATLWAMSRKRDALDERFLRNLHKRMFKSVWRWAGEYRQTERNIGVEPYRIQTEMRRVIDDGRYWLAHKSYSVDELSIRLHHALVLIHPFPNGNGRWSRLAADLFAVAHGSKSFSWGRSQLSAVDETRAAYISALRAADQHDIAPLLNFARS